MTPPALPLPDPKFDETAPLQTEPDAVLERARIMLGTRGFAVTVQGRRLLAQGPPLNSPSEPPVVGGGRLVLDVDDDTLRLASDLSGLERLRWFVLFAPPLLAVALGAAMTAAGTEGALKPALINAILWMFIGPALAVWLRKRTERALLALLQTLAAA
jgi:hypothetical protein